jgi:hypothetical protein
VSKKRKKLSGPDVILLVLGLAGGRPLTRCQLCVAVWLIVRVIPARYLRGNALKWRRMPFDGCGAEETV